MADTFSTLGANKCFNDFLITIFLSQELFPWVIRSALTRHLKRKIMLQNFPCLTDDATIDVLLIMLRRDRYNDNDDEMVAGLVREDGGSADFSV